MKALIAELRRRNVIRTTTYYIGAAWVVIGACDILFPMVGISDSVLRVVILSALAGIPIIIALSWIFELTPSGVTVDETPADVTPQRHSPMDLVLIAILGGALTISVVINLQQGSLFTETSKTPLVAVVPFDDLSENNTYISNGLAAELLTILVRAPNIRVMSEATAFELGATNDVVAAARKLEADFVIRGSVRGEDGQFRLIVRLIDVPRGEVVWANDYSGILGEVFVAQQKVAAAVASSLDVAIEYAHSSEQGQLNAQAVDFYLQATNAIRTSGSLDAAREAREWVSNALRLQPNFIAAQAYLCRVHMMVFTRTEVAADFQDGQQSCEAALELDPDSPHTRLALSTLYNNAGRHAEANAIAVELTRQLPNWEQAYSQLGFSAWRMGDLEAAEQAYKMGVSLSPADYRPHLSLGNFYARNQMYEAALVPFGEIARLIPDDFLGYASLGVTHYEMGNYAQAEALTRQALEIDKSSRSYFNLGLIQIAQNEHTGAAQAFRESLTLNPKNYRALLFLSQSLELEGDETGAEAAAREAIGVLEELIEVNPNDAYVISNAATLHAHYSGPEVAIGWAERARTVNNQDPKVQFNIGLTYYQVGQEERGIDELIAALDMGYPRNLFESAELPPVVFEHPKIRARLSESADESVASQAQDL